VSHAMPRPVAMQLAATACLHHGSVARMEFIESEKAPVLRLMITSAPYLGFRVKGRGVLTYAARATS
jgi:hypothetical protein